MLVKNLHAMVYPEVNLKLFFSVFNSKIPILQTNVNIINVTNISLPFTEKLILEICDNNKRTLSTCDHAVLLYVLHRCTISEQLLKPYLMCGEAKRQQEHHTNAASHHLAPSEVEAITSDMKGI